MATTEQTIKIAVEFEPVFTWCGKPVDSLTIDELRVALKHSIRRGLEESAWHALNKRTWDAFEASKRRTAMGEKDSHLMGQIFDAGHGSRPSEIAMLQARAQYEAWIERGRKRAQWAKARQFAKWMIFALATVIAAGAALVYVTGAHAAPLAEPKARPKIEEPEASPHRGVTLREMREKCEQRGGHWLQEDGGEQMPNHVIVGCLFAVPKGAK